MLLPAELRGGWALNDEYMMCRSSWGVGYPSWDMGLTPENMSKIRGEENLSLRESVTGRPWFSICNILLLAGPATGGVRHLGGGGAYITRPVSGALFT